MTTIISIIICLIASLSPKLNCADYKTGTFSIKDKRLASDQLIERNDSIQTETDLRTGAKSTFKVTWVNDCEYELNIIEGRQEEIDFFSNKTLTIQITTVDDDSYSFKSFIKGTDMVVAETAMRVTTKNLPHSSRRSVANNNNGQTSHSDHKKF